MPWRKLVPALGLLFVVAACRSEPSRGRVVVLGFDGMDPGVVDLLMSEGKMPSFGRLRQRGAYGRLVSSKPLLSPVVWTTVATGKEPDQHAIGHFVAVNQQTGEQLPVTSQMRRVKALWNIFSDAGRQVAVVGWWATWPAETVRGTIVSDHTCYHFLFPEAATGGGDATASISPPEQAATLAPMIRRPDDLSPADIAPFASVSADEVRRPFDFEDELSHLEWALAAAETYRGIGLHLLRQQRPDLLMLYVEATDSTAHLFGHLFRTRDLAGELAEQQRRFGQTVEAMYVYADRVVGEFLEAIDDDTTLVVLSDHGFALGELPDDPSRLRDMRRVSEHFHRIEGILYLYGRGVRPHARIDRPTILDVAPTILELSGLSPARDMPGRVLAEALDGPARARSVASYEGVVEASASTPGMADPAVNQAIRERLRSLGYLDAESPKGERNLAAISFQQGRFEQAAEAYAKLVQAEPADGALRASFAGALGALGRFDEALAQLDVALKLEPLNPESHHNRAVIFERQGKREAAVDEYRAALRYNPGYEPSRAALLRLGGSAAAQRPRAEAETLASALAERASRAARHGDYAGAMQQLDEAERIAPRYALVHQYRSNVAFLMGDRDGAIRALRSALEIEPDNELYRTNLRRLEQAEGAKDATPAEAQ